MYKFDFVGPSTPEEAVAALKERGPGGKPLAGGTDLLLQVKARVAKPPYVVDLSKVSRLADLDDRPGKGLWLGACVRARTIQLSPSLLQRHAVIVDGAKLIGSIQIRNLATVGGNICNAAPSADCAPPLYVVGAIAHILGPNGRRQVPIDQFILGPRKTALADDEILVGLQIPEPAARSGGHYLRHTPRREMDIAVVGVASYVRLDNGQIGDATICLGAVGPTPIRAVKAEALLRGQKPSDDLIAEAARVARDEARPISDVRGSADYRRHLVQVLTERTLAESLRRAVGAPAA